MNSYLELSSLRADSAVMYLYSILSEKLPQETSVMEMRPCIHVSLMQIGNARCGSNAFAMDSEFV